MVRGRSAPIVNNLCTTMGIKGAAETVSPPPGGTRRGLSGRPERSFRSASAQARATHPAERSVAKGGSGEGRALAADWRN